MTISRVKPDWALGDKLTSGELDAIEDNTTFALDKRSGQTDTLESDVTVTGDTSVEGETTFTGNVTLNNLTTVEGTLAVDPDGMLLIQGPVAVASAGEIEFGTNYPKLAVAHPGRTVARRVAIPFGITSVAATDNAFTAGAGSNPFLPFSSGGDASRTIAGTTFSVVDTGSTVQSSCILFELSAAVRNASTITEVSVRLKGAGAHAGLPARMPRIAVIRGSVAAGFSVLHSSGATATDSSASTATYQTDHAITVACDQNNTVAKATYSYFVAVWNEGGTNGLVGLNVYDVLVTQTITDLQPS